MRVRLDRTSCETSLTIFAFSLGERVRNHFASRCENSILISLCKIEGWVTVGVAYHFTLPGKQDEVANNVISTSEYCTNHHESYLMGILRV